MGNSVRRVGLLSTVGVGGDEPFHYQLGTKVSIDLSRRKVAKRSGSRSENWTMIYTLGDSTCAFNLTRGGIVEGAKGLLIELLTETSADRKENFPEYGFHLDVKTVVESDALVRPNWSFRNGGQLKHHESKKIHPGGSVTETGLFLFGYSEKKGLIVLEMKKKSEGGLPYAVTLVHYFAASIRRSRTDVGLSVVAKIRASNGNLDITVEGPDQHPAAGLHYLFDEALRTKIWKPTLCPHCATIQEQRSTTIGQSDSEDSESVPVARRHGGKLTNLRGIDNSGQFNGDGNGNFTENNFTFIGNKWFSIK